MRRHEVEETARASSCTKGLEVKFYSKCYMKPLRDFKQKRKRKKNTCHSLNVPKLGI